ncbi:Peptidase S54 [Macleaya cordata]|uniref:RHOMBOID-like protein n=1 Tax=Macleaya cordata TaxID=56857 RepID=A0A200PQD6_MACCD|nr:Peptidase S54 [Macleaya cordata]
MVDVAAFVFTMYLNNCPATSNECVLPELGRFSFQPFTQNRLFGPSTTTLEKLGALEWKLVVKEGEPWRLISCIWLHAGVVHLVANMMSLLFVGIRLEQEFGFLRIGLLFVLSGFGGSLLSSINLGSTISVGASGALFGLLGAMLSELITNWSLYSNKCAALFTLIIVIALNLAVSILPHVDAAAHIGGFISGFFLGFVVLIRPQFGWVSRKHIPAGYDMKLAKPKHKCYQYLLCAVSVVLLLAGYIL